MIETFKNAETKQSGIIYKASLDSVKELYLNGEIELAFETAVAYMELACGGEISSNNYMVKVITANFKEVAEKANKKYEEKQERTKENKIENLKLKEIAEMLNNGETQKSIGDKLNISQQVVSYRKGVIESDFPFLLKNTKIQKEQIQNYDDTKNTKIQKIQKHDNDNDNDNVNDNYNANEKENANANNGKGFFGELLF